MNKQELIEAAVQRASATITKKDADIIITATLEAIMGAVAEGEKVTLVGFGTFERRDRKERVGRNPKSGMEMTIPAAKVPAFSSGKLFKERVNTPPKASRKPKALVK
ncbi:MAG TPA: HU family DNA-binding protein [Nodosilinea sp.]|nr:HU family DNA-binding protein [Nodosilinea sp.]